MNFRAQIFLLIFLGGACLSGPAAAANGECRIEKIAGWIIDVDGDATHVSIRRQNRLLPAAADDCILYGDRIDTDQSAVVVLDLPSGRQILGRMGGPTSITIPAQRDRLAEAVSSDLADKLSRLLGDKRPPMTSGAARAATNCAAGAPASIRSLPLLLPIRQFVSPEVKRLFVGWRQEFPSSGVTVSLLDGKGRIVEQVSPCARPFVDLTIPAGHETNFTLRIADPSAAINYPIVVAQTDPKDRSCAPPGDRWLCGARLLAEGGLDRRLEALSLLREAANVSPAAQALIDAVLSGRSL